MYRIFFILFSILQSFSSTADALIASNTKSINMDECPSFIVSIGTENNHICGGALISQRHVLTSELCVQNQRAKNLKVSIGPTDLLSDSNYEYVNVESVMRFDDWIKRHHSTFYPNNDIAILTLKQAVTDVKPGLINDTSLNINFYGKNVVTVGWEQDDDKNLLRCLQTSVLKVLTPDQCNENLYRLTGSRFKINEKYFCTIGASQLLGKENEGSPILYNNLIIGVNHGKFIDIIGDRHVEQDLHIGLEYYQRFIQDILSNA
ncbi:mite allergen Der f 6-like [Phymastichus coffea]|uniref:mite allergen Der f 6-like n=1 Tax=Phymastichus coffea TaxID=108790 RepID=UPI00273CDDF7|nr:mite allergen Der f 6-like [Phymastichus coffea]